MESKKFMPGVLTLACASVALAGQGAKTRVWTPSVYETIVRKVVIPAEYRTISRRVWIDPVHEYRMERVWVPAEWGLNLSYQHKNVHFGLKLGGHPNCAGYYKVMPRRVCVQPGHWRTIEERILVRAERLQCFQERVLVKAGHWKGVPVCQPNHTVVPSYACRSKLGR